MSALRTIRNICAPCRRTVHQMRVTAVECAVEGIIRGGRLCPSQVGRALRSAALPKHSIKRVDRLLVNHRLHREWPTFYAQIARRVVRHMKRPIVLIDWSGTVKGLHTLAAAVPVGGRAVTIYAEVHPEAKYGNRAVQERFLQTLQQVIGPNRRPVIVADAGFGAPFMNAVKALQWDFVIRVRGSVCVRKTPTSPWVKVKTLYRNARRSASNLGLHQFTRERSTFVTPTLHLHLVLAKKPRRRGPKRRFRAPVSGAKNGRGPVQAAREPWLLATSLEANAAHVVQLYALRMQIEETFRDTKSHRFGWSLRHVNSKCHKRMTTLVMLAALATFVVVLHGVAAEQQGMHRRYQANTLERRVLSYFTLGRAVLATRRADVDLRQVAAAAQKLFASNADPTL